MVAARCVGPLAAGGRFRMRRRAFRRWFWNGVEEMYECQSLLLLAVLLYESVRYLLGPLNFTPIS
jgi:hypothetical protein